MVEIGYYFEFKNVVSFNLNNAHFRHSHTLIVELKKLQECGDKSNTFKYKRGDDLHT